MFAENGIRYMCPSFDMKDWKLFQLQMHQTFSELLQVTPEENEEAMDIAYGIWRSYYDVSLRQESRKVLDQLEAEGRVGVVLLGRPYHNDPGLNHEIMEEIQKRGYPIFSIDSLPHDPDILERLFGEEIRAGAISDAMEINDVWKNCYSENSSRKVWGAKYVARHPNLVAVDLSSFKCGHDAPIYNVVESIIEASGTPFFTFHDIDENKPSGSIKIRVETIDYFLQRYQDYLKKQLHAEGELQQMVDAYRAHLERLNEKAIDKLEAASTISISGNDSQRARHNGRGHELDELGMPHHGSDVWQPIKLDLGDGDVLNVAKAGSGNANGLPDSSTYDGIRAANTADDLEEDEFASGSASCNSPAQDHAMRAFGAQDGACCGDDHGHHHNGNGLHEERSALVQLVNFKLKTNGKRMDTDDKVEVHAD